jgi:hypothetical protein
MAACSRDARHFAVLLRAWPRGMGQNPAPSLPRLARQVSAAFETGNVRKGSWLCKNGAAKAGSEGRTPRCSSRQAAGGTRRRWRAWNLWDEQQLAGGPAPLHVGMGLRRVRQPKLAPAPDLELPYGAQQVDPEPTGRSADRGMRLPSKTSWQGGKAFPFRRIWGTRWGAMCKALVILNGRRRRRSSGCGIGVRSITRRRR